MRRDYSEQNQLVTATDLIVQIVLFSSIAIHVDVVRQFGQMIYSSQEYIDAGPTRSFSLQALRGLANECPS
jgi:hypothetical protein